MGHLEAMTYKYQSDMKVSDGDMVTHIVNRTLETTSGDIWIKIQYILTNYFENVVSKSAAILIQNLCVK